MSRYATLSRSMSVDLAELERRLRALEKRLEPAGGRVIANASQAVDRIGDAVAGALADVGDRLRGGARSVTDETSKFGNEAAHYGNLALRRIATEVGRRPLAAIAVAAAIGILLGLSKSHASVTGANARPKRR